MAGTTSKGLPYPVNTDPVNVAVDIQSLAAAVDTLLNSYDPIPVNLMLGGL